MASSSRQRKAHQNGPPTSPWVTFMAWQPLEGMHPDAAMAARTIRVNYRSCPSYAMVLDIFSNWAAQNQEHMKRFPGEMNHDQAIRGLSRSSLEKKENATSQHMVMRDAGTFFRSVDQARMENPDATFQEIVDIVEAKCRKENGNVAPYPDRYALFGMWCWPAFDVKRMERAFGTTGLDYIIDTAKEMPEFYRGTNFLDDDWIRDTFTSLPDPITTKNPKNVMPYGVNRRAIQAVFECRARAYNKGTAFFEAREGALIKTEKWLKKLGETNQWYISLKDGTALADLRKHHMSQAVAVALHGCLSLAAHIELDTGEISFTIGNNEVSMDQMIRQFHDKAACPSGSPPRGWVGNWVRLNNWEEDVTKLFKDMFNFKDVPQYQAILEKAGMDDDWWHKVMAKAALTGWTLSVLESAYHRAYLKANIIIGYAGTLRKMMEIAEADGDHDPQKAAEYLRSLVSSAQIEVLYQGWSAASAHEQQNGVGMVLIQTQGGEKKEFSDWYIGWVEERFLQYCNGNHSDEEHENLLCRETFADVMVLEPDHSYQDLMNLRPTLKNAEGTVNEVIEVLWKKNDDGNWEPIDEWWHKRLERLSPVQLVIEYEGPDINKMKKAQKPPKWQKLATDAANAPNPMPTATTTTTAARTNTRKQAPARQRARQATRARSKVAQAPVAQEEDTTEEESSSDDEQPDVQPEQDKPAEPRTIQNDTDNGFAGLPQPPVATAGLKRKRSAMEIRRGAIKRRMEAAQNAMVQAREKMDKSLAKLNEADEIIEQWQAVREELNLDLLIYQDEYEAGEQRYNELQKMESRESEARERLRAEAEIRLKMGRWTYRDTVKNSTGNNNSETESDNETDPDGSNDSDGSEDLDGMDQEEKSVYGTSADGDDGEGDN